MTTVWELPLSGTPQRFTMTLAGNTYQFLFQYRDAVAAGGGGWVLDLNDYLGNPIICGIPLVTGADLMAQFGYLGFPGQLWVRSDGTPDAVPTFDNLGYLSHVYYVTVP